MRYLLSQGLSQEHASASPALNRDKFWPIPTGARGIGSYDESLHDSQPQTGLVQWTCAFGPKMKRWEPNIA